jgi:putative ABC transport system permease protein
MGIRTILGNASAAIIANKRRSVVTAVSLAWAVASFLILMSYGRGFDVALLKAFQAVGQDIVFMAGGQTSEQAGGIRSGREIRLTKEDADTIRENVPLVAAISPEIMMNSTIVRGSRQKEYMLRAVVPEYWRIRNLTLSSGRWINADDNRYGRQVAVIGATVARELFGSRRAVDEEVTINGVRFTVIGILKTKVQLANYNRPDNECLFLPYESISLFRPVRYPNNFVWTPVTPESREKAIRQVSEVLAGVHRFSPSDEKAIFILAFSKFLNIVTGMSVALNLLLAFIGTVTLGIGAVGLANIMFTAVIERTREIGLRKALGARRRTILGQFLCEAVLIVLLGGMTGVVLGAAIAASIGSLPFMGVMLGEELAKEYGRIHFSISSTSILVSVGVLFLVGLIAGMLPAVRASRLDPVDALRYE